MSHEQFDQKMLDSLFGLMQIPGVGSSIAKDLRRLGIQKPEDLTGKNADELYAGLCGLDGDVDRCVLYVFRCAIYFMNTPSESHDPSLLKWWNWKDK